MSRENSHSYLYSAVRTPIGRFNGALAPVPAPELAAFAIREALKRGGFDGADIDEVIVGNVLQAGVGQAPARQAALHSGIPDTVGATTVNKVCGSGMKAVMMADQSIRLGQSDFVVAGGMENMSRAPFLVPHMRRGHKLGNAHMVDAMIHDGLWDPHENRHMGELSQMLAHRFGYDRAAQDAYALQSYTRARAAMDKGIVAKELITVPVWHRTYTQTVDHDEQPHADDLEKMASMPPVFEKPGGTITRTNGAKLSDGAAALIVGKPSAHHKPLARILGYATHAQSPDTFALAPVEAVRKVLEACQLKLEDIDLFEINEAFAPMSLAVHDQLGLDPDKVNVHGGAIALGHPIGATGARILVTLLNALTTHGKRLGCASLCIGGGEATAMVVELV
ncbi:thiolase family protein [Nitrospina watsonii]|uniref:Acetyl-CoA acetyltransferase n=1 Tax=Nitrospina watsonii TaxID=1323948 RepID=A0ABM9HFN4_9BACT|nr:thiolase family protein [Nitrospina watsonii]CAI2719138.1 acetyl-CoA acetyltransferase [Nitrospina watsonii]